MCSCELRIFIPKQALFMNQANNSRSYILSCDRCICTGSLNTIDELCLLLALPLLVCQLYRQPLRGAPAGHPGPGAVAPKTEIGPPSPQTLLALGYGDQHLQTTEQ